VDFPPFVAPVPFYPPGQGAWTESCPFSSLGDVVGGSLFPLILSPFKGIWHFVIEDIDSYPAFSFFLQRTVFDLRLRFFFAYFPPPPSKNLFTIPRSVGFELASPPPLFSADRKTAGSRAAQSFATSLPTTRSSFAQQCLFPSFYFIPQMLFPRKNFLCSFLLSHRKWSAGSGICFSRILCSFFFSPMKIACVQ